MKQITIYDLAPMFKKGYAACNSRGGWRYFTKKPYALVRCGWWVAEYGDLGASRYLDMFNLKPFEGDWKDSLIKVGGNKTHLTRADIEKIMQSPKYWRDQYPELLKMVEEGFKRLYG